MYNSIFFHLLPPSPSRFYCINVVVWERHLNSELHFKNSASNDLTVASRIRKRKVLSVLEPSAGTKIPKLFSVPEQSSGTKRGEDRLNLLVKDLGLEEETRENRTAPETGDDRTAPETAENGTVPEKKPERSLALVECESCGARVQDHQIPKHLISHFHYHR